MQSRSGKDTPRFLFDPTPSETGSGTTAALSWDHREVRLGIERMFGIRSSERIDQIELTAEAITVRLSHVSSEAEANKKRQPNSAGVADP